MACESFRSEFYIRTVFRLCMTCGWMNVMGLRIILEIEIESSGDMWMEERYWFASHLDQSYFEMWTVFRLFMTYGWRRVMGLRVIFEIATES